jgi:CRP-like cAMP-binding protein
LDEDEFDYIVNKISYLFTPEGKDVIKYGEVGDKFYIILSGAVAVLVPDVKKVEPTEETE